ncbi:LTA synthase family protein [Paenibacillus cisolokensis]|uniref:LTA synthase family protein n=1 Tax=Paenibacillus cisolokensis TaxID=1658519 RepID=UPI003D298D53
MFRKSFWLQPFVLFSVLMILKMYMAWWVIFGDGWSWKPLLTGLPSVWAAFALIELFASRRKLAVYLIVNTLLTTVYFAVIMYYKYFGIIVTWHALRQVGQVAEVKGSVFQLLHPYFLLIYTDIVLIALLLAFRRKTRSWASLAAVRVRPALAGGLLAVTLFVCALLVWQNRNIVNELKQAERMGILNYEVYKMIPDEARTGNVPPESVTPQAIRHLKGIGAAEEPVGWEAAKGRHIIVVQLEAFQNFLIHLKVDGQEITPVLNELAAEGLYFPRFYQQAGAGNTSDAEYMTNTSLHVPPHGAASQVYGNKVLPSLPKLLAARLGYQSATFHTNDVQFWSRDELYAALGFDKYYDRDFFEDEDVVHFGASDEVLYRKTAAELAELAKEGRPIYANVISMSAHHPFNLPERKNRIDLPERFDDTFVGDYLRSQNYADYALGLFIEELKKNGLWDDCLLVIYGDHMGVPIYSLTDVDLLLMEELIRRPYDYTQMLNIPLLLIAPGALEPQVLPQIGGQMDIMPTVANLVGLPLQDTVHFGQDLLNETHNLLPERYYLPSGSFINDTGIFIPGASFEDGQTIPLPGARKGFAAKDEFERALKLLRMSDSYVKSLPERE